MSNTNAITTKQIPNMTAIAITRKVTIDQISTTAEACVPHLFQVAEAIHATVIGPCEFIYDGYLNDETSSTYLTMALPIQPGPTDGPIDGLSPEIHICQIPACSCATLQHLGSMEDICSTYKAISDHADKENLHLNKAHFREVYHNWVDYSSPNNITEIQVAIAS
ncbi:Bacterial transcription activator, effector binding domain [Poriferisphaera corsica]|uniref:Bacterial transcription activator, effector binding domain n=1 Tax=Poriferisphaera corsica TaxID=2528020 RepID=A0A517YQ52_9BACT|nr:GyrI-like domain-containing protein [Poriferisphaera corsica]QDU32353.1 Bacterial transcription activator, effector binding domain [Poriferisphaera corsica]